MNMGTESVALYYNGRGWLLLDLLPLMVLLMRALHLELHLEQGEGKLVMALEMKGMRAQMPYYSKGPHRDMKLMKRAAVDNSRCGDHMLVINQWVLMRALKFYGRRVLSLSLRESFTGYGP
jgi:hypothetical protein